MSNSHRFPDSDILNAIDLYLGRLESMVSASSTSVAFFHELTRGLIQTCGAMAVGVWILENGRPQCLTNSGEYSAELPDELRESTLVAGKQNATSVSVNASSLNGCNALRFLASSPIHNESVLVLDVWRSESEIELTTVEFQEILKGVSELAVGFTLRSRLDELSQRVAEQQTIHQILAISQQAGDLEDKSQALASTLMEALDRDRVSVFQVLPTGTRLLALVPAANLNQRSSQIGLLSQLATGVARDGGWLVERVGEGLKSSPGLKSLVDPYVQASLAREIWALGTSLRRSNSGSLSGLSEGVIILEKFTLSDASTPQFIPVLKDVGQRESLTPDAHWKMPYRESLLAHSLDVLSQQLSSRRNLAIRMRDRWQTCNFTRKLLVVSLTSLLLVLSLFLFPAQLKFTVDGSLQPKTSRSIFATRDGFVESLYVHHGELISQGQPLLKIRSPDLELEFQKLTGQMETLEAKLLSLRSAKTRQGNDRATENALRQSTEEEDLRIQLQGVRKQLQIVRADQETLTLLSPLHGEIDGWEIEHSLDQAPVFHGQKLLQVITPEDGWQLELEIPDDFAGYILEAQKKGACKVDFRVRSDPSQNYLSKLSSLSHTAQVNAAQKAVVLAQVDLSTNPIALSRSGAKVVAQVDCGRSTIGYIWFREMMEFCQRSFWL